MAIWYIVILLFKNESSPIYFTLKQKHTIPYVENLANTAEQKELIRGKSQCRAAFSLNTTSTQPNMKLLTSIVLCSRMCVWSKCLISVCMCVSWNGGGFATIQKIKQSWSD